MKQLHIVLLLTAAVVLTGLLLIPGVVAGDGAGNSSADGELLPGERMGVAADTQGTELANEVSERAFGQAIATAAAEGDTSALADLIAERAGENEARFAELADELADLQAAYDAGEISEREYRHGVAKIHVELRSLERTSTEAANAATGMPVDVLEDRGINVTAIEMLRNNASELGGEQVREIARSIAGPHVGETAPERPSTTDRMVRNIERIDDPDLIVDRATRMVERANTTVERVTERAERFADGDRAPRGEVDEEVWTYLESADDELAAAYEALDDANDALERGDDEAAIEHAMDAVDHASGALAYANRAAHLLSGPPADATDLGTSDRVDDDGTLGSLADDSDEDDEDDLLEEGDDLLDDGDDTDDDDEELLG